MPSHRNDKIDHHERIGRVLNEFLERRQRGENVREDDLFAAHPDIAGQLREHLRLISDLCPPNGEVHSLIERGLLRPCAEQRYVAELGPYKINRLIGRGGMGFVFEAVEDSLNRRVALKILRPEMAGDATCRRRFEREAQAAAAIRHPNIVTVYAVGEDRGVHYVAMEYIEGGSLADVIRCTPLSPDQESAGSVVAGLCTGRGLADRSPQTHKPPDFATSPHLPTLFVRRAFSELLSGLQAAHDANLIHRDIKPSNILLDLRSGKGSGGHESACETATPATMWDFESLPPEPFVRIADFGLARMVSGQTTLTQNNAILGTPEYMSPEQARGDDVDHRTDLYSAGVVLYELLTGRSPFRADTPTATLHRILHEVPRDPRQPQKTADPVLSSIALRLLAKTPDERLTVEQARHAVEAGRAPATPRATKRRKLHRFPAVSTAATIVLVLLFVVMALRSAAPVSEWPSITGVRIDKKDAPQVVQVQYGNDPDWKLVLESKRKATLGAAKSIVLNDGRTLLVVGARGPKQDDNKTLFALKRTDTEEFAEEAWSLGLHNPNPFTGSRKVPYFLVRAIVSANFDHQEGDELAVLAGDPDSMPTCLALVDPATSQRGATFWHAGQLHGVIVLQDYFGVGHHGLLTWGVFNIRERFTIPCEEMLAHLKQTQYHHLVPVVMILDPEKMDGVWPHPRGEFSRPVATPQACAYVDTWVTPGEFGATENGIVGSTKNTENNVLDIKDVGIAYETETQPDDNTLQIRIVFTGADLVADHELAVEDVIVTDNAEIPDKQAWSTRWHVVVRNGLPVPCGD